MDGLDDAGLLDGTGKDCYYFLWIPDLWLAKYSLIPMLILIMLYVGFRLYVLLISSFLLGGVTSGTYKRAVISLRRCVEGVVDRVAVSSVASFVAVADVHLFERDVGCVSFLSFHYYISHVAFRFLVKIKG